jgi:hypothetical protein
MISDISPAISTSVNAKVSDILKWSDDLLKTDDLHLSTDPSAPNILEESIDFKNERFMLIIRKISRIIFQIIFTMNKNHPYQEEIIYMQRLKRYRTFLRNGI